MTTLTVPEMMLAWYNQPGIMTDPGEYRPLLEQLPADVPVLVRVTQGLMLHVFWADQYGQELTEARKSEVQLRPLRSMLARVLELDPRPLHETRSPDRRLVGNCRHFSVLLASLLKVHHIPARARCGFGTYFIPGHYEDHWIAEYWDAGRSRWVQVDAQLDLLQQNALKIAFDPRKCRLVNSSSAVMPG